MTLLATACSGSVVLESEDGAPPDPTPTATAETPSDPTATAGTETPTPEPEGRNAQALVDDAFDDVSRALTAAVGIGLETGLDSEEFDTRTDALVDLPAQLASVDLLLTGSSWEDDEPRYLYVLTSDGDYVTTDPPAPDVNPARPWRVPTDEELTPTADFPKGTPLQMDPRVALANVEKILGSVFDVVIEGAGADTTALTGLTPMPEVFPTLPSGIQAELADAELGADDFEGHVPTTVALADDGSDVEVTVVLDQLLDEATSQGGPNDLENTDLTVTYVLANLDQPVDIDVPRPGDVGSPDDDTPTDVLEASLAVGECYTLDQLEIVGGTPIPCDQPHIAEVFHVSFYDDPLSEPFPGADDLVDRGSDVCNRAIVDHVGVRGEVSVLRIRLFRPLPDTWAIGDRELACFVQYPDDQTVSLVDVDPLRAFGQVSPFGLAVGDCLVEDDLGSNPFTLVACDDPHYYEVFVSDLLPEGPYPGDQPLSAITEERCFDAFDGYVGQVYAESVWFIEPLEPNETTWTEFDDRLVTCLLTQDEAVDIPAEDSGI